MIAAKTITNIETIWSAVVAAVSTELLAQLQAIDAFITGVHFDHGTEDDFLNRLIRIDRSSTDAKFNNFPVVWLVWGVGVVEPRGKQIDRYSEVPFKVVICHKTKQEYDGHKRQTKNFIPILNPIYYSLLGHIAASPHFLVTNPNLIEHNKAEYYSYRSKEAPNATNYMDVIEVSNLKLPIKYANNCSPISTIS